MNEEQRQSEKRQLVENAGLLFEQLGLPRMTGRAVGWLLMCGSAHQTAGQLADALQASKGSISSATHLLIRLGLIERFTLPGERRDLFRIKPGGWSQLIRDRLSAVTAFREIAERGLTLLREEGAAGQDQLEAIRELYVFLEDELSAALERWAQRDEGSRSSE